MGNPSGPRGHGASKPGDPWSPLLPLSPFLPFLPIRPTSPLVPFSPFSPGSPGSPRSPFLPGSPLEPLSPSRPGGPYKKKIHTAQLREITSVSRADTKTFTTVHKTRHQKLLNAVPPSRLISWWYSAWWACYFVGRVCIITNLLKRFLIDLPSDQVCPFHQVCQFLRVFPSDPNTIVSVIILKIIAAIQRIRFNVSGLPEDLLVRNHPSRQVRPVIEDDYRLS